MASDKVTFREAATLVRQGVQPEDVGDMPYIGLEHIEEGKLCLLGIGSAKDVTSTKSHFSKGDILFGKLRPYFRKVIRAPFDGVCSTDIWVVRSKPGIEQGYLYYWMASQTFVNFATQGSEGTKMPRAKWDHVGRFQQARLPETDQRAIAHILGSLDDKIELNRRMNKTLEAMARAIFKSWFVDFDPVRAKAEGRDPGLPNEIAALFPDSFVDSELGEIPKGWEITSVSSNAEKLSKGTTPRKKDTFTTIDSPTVPFLKVRNITDSGEINIASLEKVPRSIHEGFLKRSMLKTNDVLFSIAGTIGRVSILPEELNDSNANQAIAFIRPKANGLPATFIRLVLISDRIQCETNSRIVQGVQANVSLTVLSELKFTKPPNGIITIWTKYCCDIFRRQGLLIKESRTLASLRDVLLPKLISGELRVPDAEKLVEGTV